VIELPVVALRVSGEHTTPAAAQVSGRLRVLVVDDEMSVRVALQRYLASRGHDVEATTSATDALARLAAQPYDAVIVDMRMPGMSGEQLFRELEQHDPEHARRVIFTTGDTVSQGMREFLASSGRPCIAKPFEFSAFDQALPRPRSRSNVQ
jgi:two-component system NtrC family sensor kinase